MKAVTFLLISSAAMSGNAFQVRPATTSRAVTSSRSSSLQQGASKRDTADEGDSRRSFLEKARWVDSTQAFVGAHAAILVRCVAGCMLLRLLYTWVDTTAARRQNETSTTEKHMFQHVSSFIFAPAPCYRYEYVLIVHRTFDAYRLVNNGSMAAFELLLLYAAFELLLLSCIVHTSSCCWCLRVSTCLLLYYSYVSLTRQYAYQVCGTRTSHTWGISYLYS